MQMVDQIRSSFEKYQFILGIFTDLSKALGNIDFGILIINLENYEVSGNKLWCSKNRKQFLTYNNLNTSFKDIK